MERRSFVRTIILSSGILLAGTPRLFSFEQDEDAILVKMLYNNMGAAPGMKNLWGLSIWVELKDQAILFDTGGDPKVFISNLYQSDIDLNKLSAIVISHNHWDHINGLEAILEKTGRTPVLYVVKNDFSLFAERFPDISIRGIDEASQLLPGAWSSGEIFDPDAKRSIYEQALVLMHGSRMSILTGCSHPGIVRMIKKIRASHPDRDIDLVAGGFHLIGKTEDELKAISEELFHLDIARLAASHCTGDKAVTVFRDSWKERFIDFTLGNVQSIPVSHPVNI